MANTTIQISKSLQQKLEARKMFSKESYGEVIEDLIEDSMELSDETRMHLRQAEKDIKEGKVYTLEQIKREFGIR